MNRLLLVGQADDVVCDWMIEPLLAERRRIRSRFDLKIVHVRCSGFDEIRAAIDQHPAEVVFLTTSWREGTGATIEFVEALAARPNRPKLVYLDTFDPSSSPLFGLLPHVDRYVKKQLLRDLDAYSNDFAGGYVFADFMQRQGCALGDWHFGSPIPDGFHDRLVLGWNLGTARMLRTAQQRKVAPLPQRDIDVHCRLSYLEDDGWYAAHRRAVLEALEPLARDFVVVASGPPERVSLKRYRDEMQRARIGFSPFGWGEVTDRDYHTINHGALLVKPDMSHLVTEPDIYRDGETYVAVRWDLADAVDKCRYYLEHPGEMQAIADRARAVYRRLLPRAPSPAGVGSSARRFALSVVVAGVRLCRFMVRGRRPRWKRTAPAARASRSRRTAQRSRGRRASRAANGTT